MATAAASTSLRPPSPSPPRLAGLPRRWCWDIPAHSPGRRAFHANRRRRSTLLCAADKGPEKSFKKTIEVDRLIDMLRNANPRELDQIVVENILAFDEGLWVRLAARIDLCKSDDDKKDYEELAENVMNIVDRLVHKTDEKIEQSTDVLKAIISPVMREGEEVKWPPKDPEALELMEKCSLLLRNKPVSCGVQSILAAGDHQDVTLKTNRKTSDGKFGLLVSIFGLEKFL